MLWDEDRKRSTELQPTTSTIANYSMGMENTIYCDPTLHCTSFVVNLFIIGTYSCDKMSYHLSSNPHPNSVIIPDDDIDLNTLTDEQHDQRLADMLKRYWEIQNRQMDILNIGTEQEFKNHNDLPLARIKRIMKSDEDVRMISAEAPVLFAKACELFILDLSIRAWGAAEKTKRRTLQKEDVDAAIKNTDIFDFLRDLP